MSSVPAESCLCRRSTCRLDLFLVEVAPFFALGQNVLFGLFKGCVHVLPLQEVARLASRYQVLHVAGTAAGTRMDEVHRQDEPVFVTVQRIQPAVLAHITVPLENLCGLFPRNRASRPEKESLDMF